MGILADCGGVGWGGNQAVHTDGTDEATHGAMSVEEGEVVELEYVERPLIKIVPAVSNLFIAIMRRLSWTSSCRMGRRL